MNLNCKYIINESFVELIRPQIRVTKSENEINGTISLFFFNSFYLKSFTNQSIPFYSFSIERQSKRFFFSNPKVKLYFYQGKPIHFQIILLCTSSTLWENLFLILF